MSTFTIQSCLIVSLLFVSIACVKANDPDSFIYSVNAGGYFIKLTICERRFNRSEHTFSTERGKSLIDGQEPIGTEGTLHATEEISAFTISWNGKEIPIPRKFYGNIFDPDLTKLTDPFGRNGSIFAAPSRNGDALLIKFEGGRGAAAYICWLIVSKSGALHKFVVSDGGDDFSPSFTLEYGNRDQLRERYL